MATLIPSINTCLRRMTSGERRFARRLESHLENDYLCWYDVPVGPKRQHPDFVVLHPSRGLLILEVKNNWGQIRVLRVPPVTGSSVFHSRDPDRRKPAVC